MAPRVSMFGWSRIVLVAIGVLLPDLSNGFSFSNLKEKEVGRRRGEFSSFCASPEYRVVFVEEFEGTKLNSSTWSKSLGSAYVSQLRDAYGTEDNVWVENGTLVLRSKREVIHADGKTFNFTSGAISSKSKRSWDHGRVCIRAVLPGQNSTDVGLSDGIWPAHWMMPEGDYCWPDGGEIDIMEMINADGEVRSTYHWSDYPEKNCSNDDHSLGGMLKCDNCTSSFHEYAIEWDGESYLAFFLDGHLIHNVTGLGSIYGNNTEAYDYGGLGGMSYSNASASSNHSLNGGDNDKKAPFFSGAPFHVILNTAVGGGWPRPVTKKTVMPAYHIIDYVVVSQKQKQ
eukprot:CAMPEP_0197518624 /NCGR_PEP_ID=MMETSP1318-20131121/3850_1 /TAXON_ID=552666 /ORGANISM="Partenskyella glossopodia, Strain RCC365" /LENGTH=340 /DNA_ID=CAMNT_0043069115 /DNA_START=23 /DNA_END=1048 /DNA_ORIENTATION=+